MIAPRWGGDGYNAKTGAEFDRAEPTPDLVGFLALVERFGQDGLMLPSSGHVLDLRCRKRHVLGRIYATPSGWLLAGLYDSGKWKPNPHPAGRYHAVRPVLLAGDLTGSPLRCACTTVDLDGARRSLLIRWAETKLDTRTVVLPAAYEHPHR